MRSRASVFVLLSAFAVACGSPAEPPPPADPATAPDTEVDEELVGAGVISTDRNETFPAEDPIDGSLWFSVYDDSFDEQTIMVARRDGGSWATPEVAPFSGEWGDRAPRFMPGGSTLLFTSNRPREPGGERGDMNIWRVTRSGDAWSAPELVASDVNSEAQDIRAAASDSAIWVASNREGGLGRSDLYRVSETGAVHLPLPLNDERSQPDLWVSPDESWMILVITDHPSGRGGDDLFFSRSEGGAWSAPMNLGSSVNTSEYEYGPTLSADGEYLYFTSHRRGSADVYRVRVNEVVSSSRD